MKKALWLIDVAGLAGCCALCTAAKKDTILIPSYVTVNGKAVTDFERRDFDDGYAIRYRLPEGARKIESEATQWVLPLDATVWYQAGKKSINYEAPFTKNRVGDIVPGQLIALPITVKMPDGSYRLLTEANVVDYTDLAVTYLGSGRFAATYYADPKGFDQDGSDYTPWRICVVAKNLDVLANSDMVKRLCPPAPADRAARVAAEFPKPGRCIWQWLPAGDPKYAEQKEWLDRTKALGFEYYLIDDGWKTWRDGDMDQWACLKKVIEYGNSIGVKSFMWVDSKEMPDAASRRAYLAKVKETGAVGIKIDFIPTPSFKIMRWYEGALEDTYNAGLAVDFHGAVKPTGRERFWPHEMAREAIRGHEWHITRYKRVLPPEHDTILPFNRLVQGHADYTPMVFEKSQLIHFTWARQLAQGVVFSAPFLCFGDFPKNYQENTAADFIKAIPAVYDETRVLEGSEIGECVVLAKRKGDVWFVVVENGAKDRTIELDLSFIGGKRSIEAYSDVPGVLDRMYVEKRTIDTADKIKLDIRACGGYAAMIK